MLLGVARLLPYQVWVETDRPSFPDRCVVCGSDAETEYRPTPPQRMRGLPEPEKQLAVPYCQDCLAAFRFRQSLATRGLIALNVAVWGAYALFSVLPLGTAFAVMVPVGAAIYAPLWLKGRSMPSPQFGGVGMRAVWYRRTTYVFSFASEEYAKSFERENKKWLTPDELKT